MSLLNSLSLNRNGAGTLLLIVLVEVIKVKDDPNPQAAAGANGDFLSIAKIIDHNLESVATRAWVMVELGDGVEGHIFDFDLVVDGTGFVGHFWCIFS